MRRFLSIKAFIVLHAPTGLQQEAAVVFRTTSPGSMHSPKIYNHGEIKARNNTF